jgi:hypothetical protein
MKVTKYTKFYKGTSKQALALANHNAKRWAETQAEAENYKTIKQAMENLLNEIDSLEQALRYPTRSSLLDAIYMFSTIEEALDIVRIKVDEAHDNDRIIEEDDDELA